MKNHEKKIETVDEYIAQFPGEVQEILEKIRALIKKTSPEAVESFSYGIAAYKLDSKPLVYFGAWKDHISIYPTSAEIEDVLPEAAKYRVAKGTLKFPLAENLPYDLIKKVVLLRVKQVSED
jgi:uncharacterized protein YdhG (YjbR/CyaY superfamily)